VITLVRTTSIHPDFLELVKHLDADLALRDGELMTVFFGQHNHVPNLSTVLIAYKNKSPVGCGAFKRFNDETVEVKRMFVFEHERSQGIASKILQGLELWAKELGNKVCILETGIKQPEAIRLYEKNNYHYIPNFPPYVGVKESVCFKKIL
jgi:GNAT superfamily N-acetyltransferase